MQATAYIGHFSNGQFFSSGNVIQLPEQRRVVITVLDELPKTDAGKLTAWNDFKRMVKESAHENHLLTDDIFRRDKSSRPLLTACLFRQL